MRHALTALMLITALACATTGTVGPTEFYSVGYDHVWMAALDAAHAMGARVRIENRAAGVIAAVMDADSPSGGIHLDVGVSKRLGGADVQVSVSEPGNPDYDQIRKQEHLDLERRYLELVSETVMQMQQRYGTGMPPQQPY